MGKKEIFQHENEGSEDNQWAIPQVWTISPSHLHLPSFLNYPQSHCNPTLGKGKVQRNKYFIYLFLYTSTRIPPLSSRDIPYVTQAAEKKLPHLTCQANRPKKIHYLTQKLMEKKYTNPPS